jgi:hypothetical protein
MDDLKIRPDSVNVEHIMQQIRARIRETRGVDYTEQQIRDLAAAAFERFLDPKGAREGLFEAFRQGRVPPTENYPFEDTTLFDSHRAPLRWIRRLLRPVLKLFFNPNPLVQVLHRQSGINERNAESARVTYELLYNLVLETTRLTVELQTLKMRVESAAARLDFAERRSRVAESRPPHRAQEAQPAPQGHSRGRHGRTPPPQPAQPAPPGPPAQPAPPGPPPQPEQLAQGQAGPDVPAGSATRPQTARDGDQAGGAGEARRRKRRRRGRRGGAGRGAGEALTEGAEGGVDGAGDAAPADDRGGPARPGDRRDEPAARGAGAETPPPSDHEGP